MPAVRPQRQIKEKWNVPGDERNGRENPATGGMGQSFSEGLQRWPAEQRAKHRPDKRLRQPVKKRKRGSPQKHERRNHEHQQDVLDHVHGERRFIESRKWRADGDPKRKHPASKGKHTLRTESERPSAAQNEPPAEIHNHREENGHVNADGRRPFSKHGLRGRRHG